MSWEDKDIDDLFREAADSMRFEYNAAYFEDIEAQLPLRKRRPILLWFSALLVTLAAGGFYMYFESKDLPLSTSTLEERKQLKEDVQSSDANLLSVPAETTKNGGTVLASEPENKDLSAMGTIAIKPEREIPAKPEFGFISENNEASHETASSLDPTDLQERMLNADESTALQEDLSTTNNGGENIHSFETQEVGSVSVSHDLFETALVPSAKKGHPFFVEVGAGLGQSYIRSAENGSNRMATYSVLLGHAKHIGSWSTHFGLGVSHAAFNNLLIADRTEIYGFGLTTYENSYRFTSLTSGCVNLGLNYTVNNHTIGVALAALVPLSPRISYTQQENGVLVSEGNAFVDRSFFRMTLEPELRYSLKITESWSLGLKVNAPLWSAIHSDRISGERTVLPVNGQLLLKKNFRLK
jgi:hypothetical protein